jgi:hypothetical protein
MRDQEVSMLQFRAVHFMCALLLVATATRAEPKPADESFQAGSVWTGNVSGDERKVGPQNRDRAGRLRVVERSGENFTAEFAIRGNAVFALQLEGKIRNGQLAAKVTKIIRGAWPDGTMEEVWTGQVQGEQLILKHTSKRNLTSTAQLSLQKEGDSRKSDNQKDK